MGKPVLSPLYVLKVTAYASSDVRYPIPIKNLWLEGHCTLMLVLESLLCFRPDASLTSRVSEVLSLTFMLWDEVCFGIPIVRESGPKVEQRPFLAGESQRVTVFRA